MKPNGEAKPVLQISAAVVVACLVVQQLAAASMGISAGVDGVAMIILLGAIFTALLLLRLGRPALGMHLYALVGTASVVSMAIDHLSNGGDDIPPVLMMIHAGLVCISLTLGWRVGKWYAIVAGILLSALGIVYGQPDDAITWLALLSIFTVLARLVGKLALKVQELEEDVELLRDAIKATLPNGNQRADKPRADSRVARGTAETD